jgi:hypothetical protein
MGQEWCEELGVLLRASFDVLDESQLVLREGGERGGADRSTGTFGLAGIHYYVMSCHVM